VVAAVLCWRRVCIIVGSVVLFVGGECGWSADCRWLMARPHLICLAVCPEGPAPVAAGTHTEIAESHQPLWRQGSSWRVRHCGCTCAVV
jgi:hypothetical protein